MAKSLTILTWNVWFDQLMRKRRYTEILDIASWLKADVVCFQEVTPNFLEVMQTHPIMMSHLCSGTKWGSSRFPYGVMSLCRVDLNPHNAFVNLDSDMNRNLLTTCIDSPTGRICIGNVHLESLSNPQLRAVQMRQCRAALENYPASVLCGDFNICSYANYHDDGKPLEQATLLSTLPDYRDIWAEIRQRDGVHEGNRGYTFDTEVNFMMEGDRRERWRYDRILYRNSGSGEGALSPVAVKVVGDRPVGSNMVTPDEVENVPTPAVEGAAEENAFSTPVKKARPKDILFPSDHFGVLGVFKLN